MVIDERNWAPNATGGASTRGQMIASSAIGLGSLGMVTNRAVAQQTATAPAKTKTILVVRAIHQEEDFKCGAQRVYEALLDAKQFSAFSGGRAAEIHREVGGAFSLFAGHMLVRNQEVVDNRRSGQAWRAGSWPSRIY